jgi:hypothetical protein
MQSEGDSEQQKNDEGKEGRSATGIAENNGQGQLES